MNILVTGGAGFIGSHIVDRLIGLGHSVAVIDSLVTGKYVNLNPQAMIFEADITHDSLDLIFEQFQPNIVIHHAAQIDVQKSIEQPAFDAQVNIIGTVRLLELCVKYDVQNIIYASSAVVYGMQEYLGMDEKHPIKPLSFYGVSKLASSTT